jgi:hypothetical protein
MAGTPLQISQTRLDAYIAAEIAIISGAQEYYLEGRKVRKADLQFVQSMIPKLQEEIAILQADAAGGSRIRTGVPSW